MKTLTCEEILQVLEQIEGTLDDLLNSINFQDRPVATAKLKSNKQSVNNLKLLYKQFIKAQYKVHN